MFAWCCSIRCVVQPLGLRRWCDDERLNQDIWPERDRWFRKPAEIERSLAEGGLSGKDILGVSANPFARTLRMSSRTAINDMNFATRWQRPRVCGI